MDYPNVCVFLLTEGDEQFIVSVVAWDEEDARKNLNRDAGRTGTLKFLHEIGVAQLGTTACSTLACYKEL